MAPHTVKVAEIELGSGHPVRVMGVLNLSPESFYSGSVASTEDQIKDKVEQLEREGADIIDIGGASTAPESVYGTRSVSEDQELRRVVSVLGLIHQTTNLPLSIDTTSSKVAEKAVGLGASLVNDISGLRKDPNMAKTVADLDVPVILMAMCETPCSNVSESVHALGESIQIAEHAGVDKGNLIVDPGIGFGKPAQADYALLRELPRFVMFGHPVLVGVSRKAFIGELLGLSDPEDRLVGSVAATSIAVTRGADVIRAHDVREAKMATTVGESLRSTFRGIGENMELVNIRDEREAEIVIEQVGVQSGIRQALSRKAVTLNLLLRNVKTPAALIIKQEILALGGDAAYHHDTIDSGVDNTDVLVMGTPIHFDKLVKKLGGMNYFGIDKIAVGMQDLLSGRERR